MRRIGHVPSTSELSKAQNILAGKTEGKRKFGSSRIRCTDKIGIDFKTI
jgi:hypothetical protein